MSVGEFIVYRDLEDVIIGVGLITSEVFELGYEVLKIIWLDSFKETSIHSLEGVQTFTPSCLGKW